MPRKATAAAVAAPETPRPEAPPASTGTPIWDILESLKQPIPDERIAQREGWRGKDGNAKLVDYIEWHTAADILDENYPEWEHSIKEVRVEGRVVYCIVALTIAGITREGLGTGDSERGETGFKKAEHDALKRAAVKFGVARELYHKGEWQEEAGNAGYSGGNGEQRQFVNERPADPFLRDPRDAPSQGQERAMYAIAKALGSSDDAYAAHFFQGCTSVKQLNRKAASYMIDQLTKLQNQGQAPAPEFAGPPQAPPAPQMPAVPPVQLNNPASLPAGVTQGMPPPPQVNITPPTVPSVAQGQLADINTVNSLKILCNKKKVDPVAIASQYSGGRASIPEEMSQPECLAAHDAVAAM